jgi:hypothetical protein
MELTATPAAEPSASDEDDDLQAVLQAVAVSLNSAAPAARCPACNMVVRYCPCCGRPLLIERMSA